jgi:outer membrane biogenesis lipoprotein LolB
MKTFTRIFILGAASLALAACSQTTKEETNEAASSAADDTAANAEKAGEAIEEVGKDMQQPK